MFQIFRANQQDLVPTLAYLTGVPIPRNNLGTLLENFIRPSDKVFIDETSAKYYNAYQLQKVLGRNFGMNNTGTIRFLSLQANGVLLI